jgi:flavin reductase (DIM6/NTAB) family NADH-FMN oxidoreductase RutF
LSAPSSTPPTATLAASAAEAVTDLAVEPRAFREVMGLFATGVAVVTTGHGETLQAMTVNSVTGLSLEPLQLLFCPARRSRIAKPLQVGVAFCVNFLRHDQQAVAEHFAGRHKGEAMPARYEPSFEPLGDTVRLVGALASLACEVRSRFEGGDHWIIVGEVQALERGAEPHEPLVFFHGRFGGLQRSTGG